MEEFDDFFKEVKKRKLGCEHYCSDLYVKVTEETTEMVKNYKWEANVTKFYSNTGDGWWYDIPFAYTDYKRF